MKMYSELQINELLRALRDITQWNEQLSDDWGDVSNRALDAIRNFQQKDERVHVNQPSFNSYFIKKDGLLTWVELDEYLKSTNASQSMNRQEAIEMGFKEMPHFTIQNSLIYDLGRNRQLCIGNIGTPNEIVFISETDDEDNRIIRECIVLHNYDYDGYLTKERLQQFINLKPLK